MPGPTIQELLGLPADVTQPNPYQLFGLNLGESDRGTIDAAIGKRIALLKRAKPTADPKVWTRAVKAMQAAQKTLTDPEQKSELDAGFGIISETETFSATPTAAANRTESSSVADPLAALLPPSRSATVIDPNLSGQGAGATPEGRLESRPPEPTYPSEPVVVAPVAAAPPQSPASTAAPVIRPQSDPETVRRRPATRRRRSWSGAIFGSLTLLLLASITGGLGYFFLFGPGAVEFVKTDDGFQIKTGTRGERSAPPVAASPIPHVQDESTPGDGIMQPPPRSSLAPSGSLASSMNQPIPDLSSQTDGMSQPDGMLSEMADRSPPLNGGETPAVPMPPANPPLTPSQPAPSPTPPQPPTEQEIAGGEAAVKMARQAIEVRNWDSMKTLAEAAESQAVTDSQKQAAETLFQFAELATFYRGAVQRGLANLQTGNEINVTDTMKVLIVEASPDRLVIRLGAKNRPYSFDKIPPTILATLAGYHIPAGTPESKAAKAVFQSIMPLTTPAYRAESVDVLQNLGSVEGADPKKLAELIESLN